MRRQALLDERMIATHGARRRAAVGSAVAVCCAIACLSPSVLRAQGPVAADNPFATPAERAAGAIPGGAQADNPFATPEERAGRGGPQLLMNQEPADVVVLRERPPREELVLPLDLPGRRVPVAPDPQSSLVVRLVSDPNTQYVVQWRDVEEVRLFENRVLAEARQLAETGRFDEAFAVFTYLRNRYPTLLGLPEAEQSAVALEAKHEISQRRWENALVYCLRLNDLKQRHPQLAEILPPTVEGLVEQRLAEGQPPSARPAVDLLASLLSEHPTTAKLNTRLQQAVGEQITRAQKELTAGDAVNAQELLSAALALAPESAVAKELLAQAVAARPRVVVGVVQSTATVDADSIYSVGDAWAERRLRDLLAPPPLQLAAATDGTTLEYRAGGVTWSTEPSDERLHELKVPPGTAHRLAAGLLAAADPNAASYRPAWARHEVRVAVAASDRVTLDFGRPHPRPEALVAAVLAELPTSVTPDISASRFYSDSSATAAGERRFTSSQPAEASPGRPVEVVERRYADEDAAVAALRAGEVDVVDRIAPWHVAALGGVREIQLVRYAPLSVHCLCITSDHPLLARQEFRRALLYAIDRESILKNHLQTADEVGGSRPAHGVFSSGRSPEDALGYATDPSLRPRPFDLQAAYVLSRLALPRAENDGAAVPPLVLAYPPTAVAARACEQIRLYWSRIGMNVELRRLPTGVAADDATSLDGADLVYTVVIAPEPLVDASRLFGPGGIVPAARRDLLAPLRQLSEAATFPQARAALFEAQRTVHEQTLVLPLWQLNEYAARRSRISVGRAAPLTLYQSVDQWRVAPGVNVPLP